LEKENKDILFVKVNDSSDVRRDILESIREILGILQRFEKFKESRKEKIHYMSKLGKIVRDINRAISNLKKSLPEPKIAAVKVSKSSTTKIRTAKRETPVVRKKDVEVMERGHTSELKRLEAELSDIEGKIADLG
jgi:DNA mismatch repair ATPase MutS